MAIIISIIALLVACAALYFALKKPELNPSFPKWKYTKGGIVFYDKTGKRIVLKGQIFK